jgi:hypothetical protein
VLVANWQRVESAYQALFQIMAEGKIEFAFHAFDLLGNDSRAALIRMHFPKVAGQFYAESIDHFLACAATCKDNRNAIAHASYEPDQDPAVLTATKGLDKARTKARRYRFTLEGLREMADHTAITAAYGLSIYTHYTLIRALPTLPEHLAESVRSQIPSLDKPPLPRRWYLHSQELPEDAQPQQ